MHNILVTGCSGFIGTHVINALTKAYSEDLIYGIDLKVNNIKLTDGLDAMLTEKNIKQISQFIMKHKPDIIIHCAGVLTNDKSLALASNFNATKLLIAVLCQADVNCGFIQIGSAAEYAPIPYLQKVDEQFSTIPQNAYGESKLQASLFVQEMSRKKIIDGVVLRLFNPIGSNMNQNTIVGKLCKSISEGKEIIQFGNLATYRDYIDIRDVVKAIICAIDNIKNISGEIINVGSGAAKLTRKLVNDIICASQTKICYTEDSCGSNRSNLTIWQEANIDKAIKLLKWKPTIIWEDTIKNIAESNFD